MLSIDRMLVGLALLTLATPTVAQDAAPERSPVIAAFEAMQQALRSATPSATADAAARSRWRADRLKRYRAFLSAHGEGATSAHEHLIVGTAYQTIDVPLKALAHFEGALAGLEDPRLKQGAAFARIRALHDLRRFAAAGRAIADFKATYPDSRWTKALQRLESRLEQDAARQALVGKTAPPLGVTRTLGAAPLTLAGLRGKVVLLDFFASWNGPSVADVPHRVALQARHGKRGLRVVAVTRFYGYGRRPDTPELAKGLAPQAEADLNEAVRQAARIGYPFVFTAPATFGTYHVKSLPTVFLIGRQGRVRYWRVGAGPTTELDAMIERLLSEPE